METKHFELEVVNCPTILGRVIQTVKKRNLVINKFFAEEDGEKDQTGMIRITVQADEEKAKKLLRQFEKIVDVIKANAS